MRRQGVFSRASDIHFAPAARRPPLWGPSLSILVVYGKDGMLLLSMVGEMKDVSPRGFWDAK